MTADLPEAGSIRPMPALDPDRVRRLLREWCGADTEDADAAAAELAGLDDELLRLADRLYQSIAADIGGRQWITWPRLPGRSPMLGLFPVLAAVPLMLEYHRGRGVAEELSRLILADVGEKLRLNRELHGKPGLDVAFWFTAHVRGSLYQLGRLQFCMEGSIAAPTLGIHIRGEGGSLAPEAVRESVARALAFFPRRFPEAFADRPPRLVCDSWLLDPQLRDWLPEGSNILAFAALFDLIRPAAGAERGGHDDVWRFVFARTPDTPAERLPVANTLQRSIMAGLRAGVRWRRRGGVLEPARLGL